MSEINSFSDISTAIANAENFLQKQWDLAQAERGYGIVYLFGKEIEYQESYWTNVDNLRYGGEHKLTSVVVYLMGKNRSSDDVICTVNGIDVCVIKIEINNNFGKPTAHIKAERTNSIASVTDAVLKKITAELQPMIDGMIEDFVKPETAELAKKRALILNLKSVISRARYDSRDLISRGILQGL